MVLLTGIVGLCGVMISWRVDERPSEFFSFLMFLITSVFGVFVSLDLFMLFFFFEIAVFPKYLMIAIWGWQKTRDYGALKLTLYLFIGSMIALLGVLAMALYAGNTNFDMIALEQAGFSMAFQRMWFPVVFLGFAILAGMFPFHSWAPDGHVAAPTAISMLLAGVEMKVGAFAALRVAFVLMPDGAQDVGNRNSGAGDHQCGLWCFDRIGSNRFQICHRFFIRLAYGIGFAWFCHS